jgi:hypothetical protein
MGIDIYAFVEYLTDDTAWNYGNISLPRNYKFFEMLRFFSTRGLPKEIGSGVETAFFIPVINSEEEKKVARSTLYVTSNGR